MDKRIILLAAETGATYGTLVSIKKPEGHPLLDASFFIAEITKEIIERYPRFSYFGDTEEIDITDIEWIGGVIATYLINTPLKKWEDEDVVEAIIQDVVKVLQENEEENTDEEYEY